MLLKCFGRAFFGLQIGIDLSLVGVVTGKSGMNLRQRQVTKIIHDFFRNVAHIVPNRDAAHRDSRTGNTGPSAPDLRPPGDQAANIESSCHRFKCKASFTLKSELPHPVVTVVVPTLAADSALAGCLRFLQAQTYRDFEVVVVDNSGRGAVRAVLPDVSGVRVIENATNLGFGAAINQGWRASGSRYIASLNDDAEAAPRWLEHLVRTADSDENLGLLAPQVRLSDGTLDSAGMLIGADGSSKQRAHRKSPAACSTSEPVLLPSGSAALYRRSMLEDIGGFDDSFFLYCEDTDLGLRARWRGWTCRYVPEAVVLHRYSHSAGRASALKAYYVERNRLFVLLKNFPAALLWRAPFASALRYWWHVVYALRGTGAGAEFARSSGRPWQLPVFVVRAHAAVLWRFPSLLKKRRAIRRSARLSSREFSLALREHSIPVRQVAAL